MFCCAAEPEGEVAVVDTRATLEKEEPAAAPEPAVEEPAKGAREAPAEPQKMFAAELQRKANEDPLGLRADFADEKYVHVCRVNDEQGTAIGRYNATVSEDQKICAGDYITSINSISCKTVSDPKDVPNALRSQLTSSMTVNLEVSRPHIFEVNVAKNGQPLGLQLTYSNNGASLIIADINQGAVQNAGSKIRPGDRIVGVGGAEGGFEKLLQSIRDAGDSVQFQISRPWIDVQ